MLLTVVTAPTSEIITLDEARAQCRVTHRDEDALLAGYIMRAREHVETILRRSLAQTVYDLKLDFGWPTIDGEETGMIMPRPPLQSVASVKYIDTSGVLQTMAADQYLVSGLNDAHREGYIVPAYGVTWPSVREQREAITVRFTAGYAATPHPIKQAMLLLIEHYFSHRGPFLSGTIGQPIPHSVDDLLLPWRSFY